MILTCPQCDTRYQADEAKFPPAGRNVRCAKCGNVWHQAPAVAEPEPAIPEAVVQEASAPAPRATENFKPRSQPRAAAVPKTPWLGKAMVLAGWLVLVAGVIGVGFAVLFYRQGIAAVWPQSSSVYSALGVPVRTLYFRDLHSSSQTEDGQAVLTVTGTIFNNASRELPVPQTIRVILSDEKNHEVYRWSFAPNAATLKPGQSSKFTTRLSSPPIAARHLEILFVKDGS
ncbi:MAG TPA: DUF3426 domain-containing protein [Rhizomicrobium sp.]